MVKIGIARDQFSSTPTSRTFPGQIASFATAGETFDTPYIQTDIVGQGYPDATGLMVCPLCHPILPPPGSAPGAVIMVNPPPNPYQGIFSRHNTPNNPAEQGGKVIMDLVSVAPSVYTPRIQFTPIQP